MEPSHTKRYTYPQIEQKAAELLRQTFPGGIYPPIDIDLVAEKNELIGNINTMSNLARMHKVEAVLLVNPSGKCDILLDADTNAFNEARANFSIAHELGHIVLHEGLYDNCQTIEHSIELNKRIKHSYRKIENEANYFAGAILVAYVTIFKDAEKIYKGIMSGMAGDIIDNIQNVKPRLISTLACRYRVGVQAMNIRLRQLKAEQYIDAAIESRMDFIIWR